MNRSTEDSMQRVVFLFAYQNLTSLYTFLIIRSKDRLSDLKILSPHQHSLSHSNNLICFVQYLYNIYGHILNICIPFYLFTGTRIIYERAFLMNLKNSPLSRTPPSNVPSTLIRGCKNVPMSKNNGNNRYPNSVSRSPPSHKGVDEQFDMDL